MGIVVASNLSATPSQPLNGPPEWTGTPNPVWIAGIGGTYNLADDTTDPEDDALTFVKTTGSWPTGVSMDSSGLITATGAVVEGVTGGITVTVEDGLNPPVASSSFVITVNAASAGTFPRLGVYQIGNWGVNMVNNIPGGLTGRAERIAKHDLAIIGTWKQWAYDEADATKDGTNLALYIKSFNANIVLYKYENVIEINVGSSQLDEHVSKRNKADSEHNLTGDWWLRTSIGDKTSSWPGADRVNHSDAVDVDANGLTYAQWHALCHYYDEGENPGEDYDIDGYGVKKAYGWDGIYFDVMDWDARVTADWDEDGDDEPQHETEAVDRMTTGHIDAINAWKTLEPDFKYAGNYAVNVRQNEYSSVPARLFDAVNGPLFEHALKTEGWGGTNEFLAQMKLLMTFSTGLDPRHEFIDASNQNEQPVTHSLSDWCRYGLCMTMLDDGYFGMRRSPAESDDCVVINEYDIDVGVAIDPPDYGATSSGYNDYQLGVYKREFADGLVLLNPKGNGERTVSLPSAGAGFQWDRLGAADFTEAVEDSDVNDGATNITSQTLPERHGIIIKRVAV